MVLLLATIRSKSRLHTVISKEVSSLKLVLVRRSERHLLPEQDEQVGEIRGRLFGIQIVSCNSAHIVSDTGQVRFSRTFVGELGSPASLRHLSHCPRGTSGIDADACLARIVSFRQEPLFGPV